MSAGIVRVDLRELVRAGLTIERLERLDRHQLLDEIGGELESRTVYRIETEKHGPQGEVWPDPSPAYAARRGAGHSLLQRSGALLEGIDHVVQGETVEVFAPFVYARTHQLGDPSRNIPARPFLGISDEDETAIQGIVQSHLEALLQ